MFLCRTRGEGCPTAPALSNPAKGCLCWSHVGDSAPGVPFAATLSVRGAGQGARGMQQLPGWRVPAALRAAERRRTAPARAAGGKPGTKERDVRRLGLPCAAASPSPADAVGHLALLGCGKDGASQSLSISVW